LLSLSKLKLSPISSLSITVAGSRSSPNTLLACPVSIHSCQPNHLNQVIIVNPLLGSQYTLLVVANLLLELPVLSIHQIKSSSFAHGVGRQVHLLFLQSFNPLNQSMQLHGCEAVFAKLTGPLLRYSQNKQNNGTLMVLSNGSQWPVTE
jgi:hypothetical protein